VDIGSSTTKKKRNPIVKPINTFMCRTVCVRLRPPNRKTPPSIIHEHLSVTKYCVLCCLILDHIFLFLSNLKGTREHSTEKVPKNFMAKWALVLLWGKMSLIVKLKFVGENWKFKEIYLSRGLKVRLRLNNRPAAQ
jgi:hypothetical protein